jgi:hypothetical protein
MENNFNFGRKYTSRLDSIREQLEYFSKISRDRSVVTITATQRPTHSPQILLGTSSGIHPFYQSFYTRNTGNNNCIILDYMSKL